MGAWVLLMCSVCFSSLLCGCYGVLGGCFGVTKAFLLFQCIMWLLGSSEWVLGC